MSISRTTLITVLALGLTSPAGSETVALKNGSDTFLAGPAVTETVETSGDAFVAARTAVAGGVVGGDLHVMGFDVTVSTDVAKDLYAIGNSVVVLGKVAEDMTVAAFSIRTNKDALTTGNARLFANSVTIEGPVQGALLVTAQDVVLNAPIEGDVRVTAATITFGPDAEVNGTLTYSTKEKITVPDRVADPERVVFEKLTSFDTWNEMRDMRREMPMLPTAAAMVSGFLISLLFFVALGALMLGFMPKRLEKLRKSVIAAPGQSMVLGIIGLSILFGMVPIVALTVIGLPFVPFVILGIVVTWTLGYALGAYSIAMRLFAGFGGETDPSSVAKLVIFAIAITFIALLNFIPFVGWVANYTLVLLGIGALTRAVFQRLMGKTEQAFDIDMKPIEN